MFEVERSDLTKAADTLRLQIRKLQLTLKHEKDAFNKQQAMVQDIVAEVKSLRQSYEMMQHENSLILEGSEIAKDISAPTFFCACANARK